MRAVSEERPLERQGRIEVPDGHAPEILPASGPLPFSGANVSCSCPDGILYKTVFLHFLLQDMMHREFRTAAAHGREQAVEIIF